MAVFGGYNPPSTGGGAGTDDQILSLNPTTDILTLEDGGAPIDLSPYREDIELCDVFGNPIPT